MQRSISSIRLLISIARRYFVKVRSVNHSLASLVDGRERGSRRWIDEDTRPDVLAFRFNDEVHEEGRLSPHENVHEHSVFFLSPGDSPLHVTPLPSGTCSYCCPIDVNKDIEYVLFTRYVLIFFIASLDKKGCKWDNIGQE